jgi:hypothetical protein
MALAVLYSRALSGMEAPLVTVEVHLSNGLPSFNLVGPAGDDRSLLRCREKGDGMYDQSIKTLAQYLGFRWRHEPVRCGLD